MQTRYFTNEFSNLPSTRKVEEISTMLLRVLYDANADTDANIALVDQIIELRPQIAAHKATTLEERIRQFESAVESAAACVDQLQLEGVTDADELEAAYYDELRKINSQA